MIKLYSTHCPNCNALEMKLKMAKLDFEIIDDIEEIKEFAQNNNIKSAPIMVVDDKVMTFIDSMNWIKNNTTK